MSTLCKCCNNERISKKFKNLSLGNNCAKKFGLSQTQYQNNSSVQDDEDSLFVGFFHGIQTNPYFTLEYISQLLNNDLTSLKKDFPYLNNRELLSTLMESDPSVLSVKFPKLNDMKMSLMIISKIMEGNYQSFLNEKLQHGQTLVEAQIQAIKNFFKLPKYSQLNFDEVFVEGDVGEETVKRIVSGFKYVTSLIPDKYKEKVKNPILIIRSEKKDASFSSSSQENIIVLNSYKNMSHVIAEAFHEYIHLIEKNCEEVRIATNLFLINNTIDLVPKTLEELGLKYKMPYKEKSKYIQVYEGYFIDLYMGRTYGQLDPNLIKLCNTEVLSVALEAFFLKPMTTYLQSPKTIKIIEDFLLGNL